VTVAASPPSITICDVALRDGLQIDPVILAPAVLHGEGIETGIDLDALIGIAERLDEVLGRQLEGHVYRAGTFAAVAPNAAA
jgi:isopropylmalate/homocitrate/citramalate synthase